LVENSGRAKDNDWWRLPVGTTASSSDQARLWSRAWAERWLVSTPMDVTDRAGLWLADLGWIASVQSATGSNKWSRIMG